MAPKMSRARRRAARGRRCAHWRVDGLGPQAYSEWVRGLSGCGLPGPLRFSAKSYAQGPGRTICDRLGPCSIYDRFGRRLNRRSFLATSISCRGSDQMEELVMIALQNGQCGLCTHFGESHPGSEKLTQIHSTMKAPEDLLDDCGHPKHSSLHLKVTPMSGCDGFQPVAEA